MLLMLREQVRHSFCAAAWLKTDQKVTHHMTLDSNNVKKEGKPAWHSKIVKGKKCYGKVAKLIKNFEKENY